MTLAGLPPAQLAALFAVAGGALTLLYLLRQQRRRLEVPFLRLWEQVLRQREATTLWQRLKRWLSLLLQLLVLGLLVFALGDPRLGASRKGRTLVLLLDGSASMQARAPDGRSRFQHAQDEARRLVRDLAGDDTAVVVALDSQPAPLGGLSQDERELLQQVDSAAVRDTPADLLRALRLARDLTAGRPNPQVVIVSDGGFDDAALQAAPVAAGGMDLRYQPAPRAEGPGENLAITAFAVRRYRRNRLGYEVLLELGAFPGSAGEGGKDPVPARLELLQEGEVVDVQELSLRPGERVQRLYPNLAGSGAHLEARLIRKAGADLLPLDDRAYALLPERRRQRLLLVTGGNLFLEGALLSAAAGEENQLEVEKIAPATYAAQQAAGFDLVLFDGFTPREPPPAHALYLDPQGPDSPLPIAETIVAPLVTEAAKDHPVLRWVTLKDLNISRASVFRLGPGDVALASMLRKPILVAREQRSGGATRRSVLLGFDIRRSDLPLRVAFPVLLVNALDWLAGDAVEDAPRFATGRTWQIPLRPARSAPLSAELLTPDGQRLQLPVDPVAGVALYHGQRVGFYELRRPGERPSPLAANLSDSAESAARWRAELRVGPAPGQRLSAPETGRSAVRRALWPYLLLGALLLLWIEWWTYQRRWTV